MQNVRSELVVGTAALGAAMLIGFGLSAPPAQAGYIVTLEQVGSNVVANGSGTIDLSSLNFAGIIQADGEIFPSSGEGEIVTGRTVATLVSSYYGPTGPGSFGGGGQSPADSGGGNMVGMQQGCNATECVSMLLVPDGYVSGSALSDTATWDNATLSSLGVTPGTYEWTWGSGAGQNFTLEAGVVAAPAPAIGHGLLVFIAVGGVLFGSKLLERRREARLQSG